MSSTKPAGDFCWQFLIGTVQLALLLLTVQNNMYNGMWKCGFHKTTLSSPKMRLNMELL